MPASRGGDAHVLGPTRRCPGLDIANIPIHIVDCNVDFKHDESARNTLMQEAYDFMNSLERK